jgi:hypothetical protein
VLGHGMRWMVLAGSVHGEASSIIPHGGGAITIFVMAMWLGVIAAIVAMETQRNPWVWAVIGFVATIIVASAVNAVI